MTQTTINSIFKKCLNCGREGPFCQVVLPFVKLFSLFQKNFIPRFVSINLQKSTQFSNRGDEGREAIWTENNKPLHICILHSSQWASSFDFYAWCPVDSSCVDHPPPLYLCETLVKSDDLSPWRVSGWLTTISFSFYKTFLF